MKERNQLGIPNSDRELRVCIAAPSRDVYSETFIRKHAEGLPFETVFFSLDTLKPEDSLPLLQESPLASFRRSFLSKMGRYDRSKERIRCLTQWLQNRKIHVVLAEYGPTGLQVMAACMAARIPLVVHFHGYDSSRHDILEKHRSDYERMFSAASAIIGVSRSMCASLLKMGAPQQKIHYVPYFVDPGDFPKTSPKATPPVFLAVGRFVEKKAPFLTILAFKKVHEKYPDATLQMAGDGPLLEACRRLSHSLHLENAVTFHGKVDQKWVISAMSRSLAFVQHSVRAASGDSEGTPVAVLEAQCSGLPVISTKHMGIQDAVEEGVTGFLGEEGDIDFMADAMIRLCEASPELISTMSDAARARHQRFFSYDCTMGKLASVLRSASIGA
jgi:glycosyltransferase involved in cell wall biosynthesis